MSKADTLVEAIEEFIIARTEYDHGDREYRNSRELDRARARLTAVVNEIMEWAQ